MTSRRRRPSSAVARRGRTIYVPALRHRHTGTFILVVMIILAVFYAGMRVWGLRTASIVYGGVVPGASRADIRYFMGPAPLIEDATGAPHKPKPGEAETARDWLYDNNGARTRIRFDDADGVAMVACADPRGSPFSCPDTLGISTGSGEDEIWDRLGVPSAQSYAGDIKLIDYRDLGLQFALRRGANDAPRVIRITLVRRPGPFGFLMRVPTALIP